MSHKGSERLFLIVMVILIILPSCKKRYDPFHAKSRWIKQYFKEIEQDKYDNIYAVSWWNEDFDRSFLTVNSSRRSLRAYRKKIENDHYISEVEIENSKLVPVEGKKYHGAFPDFEGTEDIVSQTRIHIFEDMVGKEIAWAYFSNNWGNELKFPTSDINEILATGKIPFIRMLSRSDVETLPDPKYDLIDIIEGEYDDLLIAWAQSASQVESPLLVEFGTEVNGDWFPWNGKYFGAGKTTNYGDSNYPDGPEIFRDAYRHIIDVCNEQGADNITWFFHMDTYDSPEEDWNTPSNYYPGDEYIDWLGISTYGPQQRGDDYIKPSELLSKALEQLQSVSTNKPFAILEFGITEL